MILKFLFIFILYRSSYSLQNLNKNIINKNFNKRIYPIISETESLILVKHILIKQYFNYIIIGCSIFFMFFSNFIIFLSYLLFQNIYFKIIINILVFFLIIIIKNYLLSYYFDCYSYISKEAPNIVIFNNQIKFLKNQNNKNQIQKLNFLNRNIFINYHNNNLVRYIFILMILNSIANYISFDFHLIFIIIIKLIIAITFTFYKYIKDFFYFTSSDQVLSLTKIIKKNSYIYHKLISNPNDIKFFTFIKSTSYFTGETIYSIQYINNNDSKSFKEDGETILLVCN